MYIPTRLSLSVVGCVSHVGLAAWPGLRLKTLASQFHLASANLMNGLDDSGKDRKHSRQEITIRLDGIQ